MVYMGSKARIAKEILAIMLAERQPGQTYVEPFAGGFNVVCRVGGPRIANELNPWLVAMFRALQSGWVPPEQCPTKEIHDACRAETKHELGLFDAEFVAFVGFSASFSGKWFGSYAPHATGFPKPNDRQFQTRRANIMAQVPGLVGVDIRQGSYQDLEIPPRSLIYCDPPYKGTAGYKNSGKFDHAAFWNWARARHAEGNTVFVSEYAAPEDFICVWEKTLHSQMGHANKRATEKLFIPNPIW